MFTGLKNILEKFNFSNKQSKYVTEKKNINVKGSNNYFDNKTLILNNPRINFYEIPFSKIKKDKNYKEIIREYFNTHDSKSSNKLTFTYGKKLNSLNQLDTLTKNHSFIEKLKYLGVNYKYYEDIQNAIYLSTLSRKWLKNEKIKLSPQQNRILNLYSSNWIQEIVEDISNRKNFIDINIDLKNLIENEKIIFINRHMEDDISQIQSKIETLIYKYKVIYLEAIGNSNAKLCRKIIKDIDILIEVIEKSHKENFFRFTLINKFS